MLTVLYLVFLSGAIVRALRENVFAAFMFSLSFGFCSEFQVDFVFTRLSVTTGNIFRKSPDNA